MASSVRAEIGEVAGVGKYVTGIETDDIGAVYNFDWEKGSDAVLGQLGEFGAIVDKDFAEDHGLEIGDRFRLLSTAGRATNLEVQATYNPPPFYQLLGSVSIVESKFDELYDRPRNQFTFINVPGSRRRPRSSRSSRRSRPTRMPRYRRAKRGSQSRTRSSTSS